MRSDPPPLPQHPFPTKKLAERSLFLNLRLWLKCLPEGSSKGFEGLISFYAGIHEGLDKLPLKEQEGDQQRGHGDQSGGGYDGPVDA